MATIEPMKFGEQAKPARPQDQSPNPKATFYPDKKPPAYGKVRVTLRLDYEQSKAGDEIDVEEGTAQALCNQGIAKRT